MVIKRIFFIHIFINILKTLVFFLYHCPFSITFIFTLLMLKAQFHFSLNVFKYFDSYYIFFELKINRKTSL